MLVQLEAPYLHRCLVLQLLEVICASQVGGSLLYIVASYCEC